MTSKTKSMKKRPVIVWLVVCPDGVNDFVHAVVIVDAMRKLK